MKRAFFLILCFAATVQAEPTPTPAPVEMTQAEYNATVLHRDALIQQRNSQLEAANAALTAQLAQLDKAASADTAAARTVPDLQTQIRAQDATITSLKWSRWKYAILSVLIALPLGFAAAIAAFLFTKFSVFAAGTAAKLGLKTALA